MAIGLDDRVRANESALTAAAGDELVALNIVDETYYSLDGVGRAFWDAVTTNDSLRAACRALQEEFDVEPDRLERDLLDLVERLLTCGLLRRA